MKEAVGTPAYGPGFEWPSRLVDAFVILQTELVKVENARMRAETSGSGAE